MNHPNLPCPPWCDPRAHTVFDPENCEHGTPGLSWVPVVADTKLTVRLVQLANVDDLPDERTPYVSLQIDDITLGTMAATDLDPADCRMLAAALVVQAEKLELLLRHRAVTR